MRQKPRTRCKKLKLALKSTKNLRRQSRDPFEFNVALRQRRSYMNTTALIACVMNSRVDKIKVSCPRLCPILSLLANFRSTLSRPQTTVINVSKRARGSAPIPRFHEQRNSRKEGRKEGRLARIEGEADRRGNFEEQITGKFRVAESRNISPSARFCKASPFVKLLIILS